MDAAFLERILGGGRRWGGPCAVILDAEATVRTHGPDSITQGGQKAYAPRVATGRVAADAVLLLKEENVLLTVEQYRVKDHLGQFVVKQTLCLLDVKHIVGVEFDHLDSLRSLGVPPPPPIRESEYRPGTLVG